jgi:protein-S-isoprenylcysteine O-methyltransferase Ste14
MKASKIMPMTYLLIFLLAGIASHLLFPLLHIVSSPWNLAGIIPLVLGVALNLMADRAFHMAHTTVRPFEESSALITRGVFQLSRNPMYLGFVLIQLGVAVVRGSLMPLLLVPAFAVLLDRVFITGEERMLAERFGAEWEAYNRGTRRWL